MVKFMMMRMTARIEGLPDTYIKKIKPGLTTLAQHTVSDILLGLDGSEKKSGIPYYKNQKLSFASVTLQMGLSNCVI